MNKHVLQAVAVSVGSLFLLATPALAHVVVTPSQVGVAKELVFSVSVPNEKELAVTGLRLVVPKGVSDVSPTVKNGWTVDTKKDTDQNVTEIDWTGGTIPAEERDDFSFGAQAPSSPTVLNWKAYQTYSDGTIVSWDATPDASKADDDSLTPYSTTQVVDDLSSATAPASDQRPWVLAGVAIVLAALSFMLSLRRR